MYILPNKTNKLYDFSPSYKEENIHITTNSIFALIFSYGGYIQWGILKNLEKLSDQDHSAVAVFNEHGQIKETFFKGLFFHFTSACKHDLKCPSAYSCPCALKDATAFS